MKQVFNKLARTSLILVYLVIMAGAVVRMTGSGMGCPDWPKCFGYLIPPTEEADLEWQPGRSYKKGQVIIWNEALLVATTDFTTQTTFVPEHWTPYTRHDYAVFNPFHTWTEFINRLLGVLAGLSTLVLALVSIKLRKESPLLTFLAWLVVLAMGFQGWLGAVVVYSVLEPVKITLHMLMALGIVALLCYLLYRSSAQPGLKPYDAKTRTLLFVALLLTLVQIGLGTQVRQFIDEQADTLGEAAKGSWLEGAGPIFYVHRSLSILVLALNGWLLYRFRKNGLNLFKMGWVMALIGIVVLTGVFMNYLAFPFGTQALHLFLASLIFGLQFYLLLEGLHTVGVSKSL